MIPPRVSVYLFPQPKFCHPLMEKPILKRWILTGKDMNFIQEASCLGRRQALVQRPTLRFLPGPRIFLSGLGQLISKGSIVVHNISWLCADFMGPATDVIPVLRSCVRGPGPSVPSGCAREFGSCFLMCRNALFFLGKNAQSIDSWRKFHRFTYAKGSCWSLKTTRLAGGTKESSCY